MPHPDRLPASEAEAVTAEATALLTLQVPDPAQPVSALESSATLTFRGGITVKSSLADTPQVYLNSSMTLSEMVSEIRKLPGVRGIDVQGSGWHRREVDLTITFLAEEYAIGDVPTLSIVSNDVEGAHRSHCGWNGGELNCPPSTLIRQPSSRSRHTRAPFGSDEQQCCRHECVDGRLGDPGRH